MSRYRKRKRESDPESLSDDDGSPGFICDCPRPPRYWEEEQFYLCRDCIKQQHFPCSPDDGTIGDSRIHLRCNVCFPRALSWMAQKQKQKLEELERMVEKKKAERDDLYRRILWTYYCLLLPHERAPPALNDLCDTRGEDGITVPINPAPEAWVNEVTQNVSDMMDAVGEETWEAFKEEGSIYKHERDGVLIPWREMALKLLHHGSYWRQKSKFGVLGEILGLIEIGTFWRRWMPEEDGEGDDGGDHGGDDGNVDDDEDDSGGGDDEDSGGDDGDGDNNNGMNDREDSHTPEGGEHRNKKEQGGRLRSCDQSTLQNAGRKNPSEAWKLTTKRHLQSSFFYGLGAP